jgi:peroxiredoxin
MFRATALCLAIAAARFQGAAAPAVGESTGRVGEKIPQFVAKVLRGDKEVDLDSLKQGKPTVYFLAGTTCPATTDCADRLAALVDGYGSKGVDFVFLYPNKNESAADKRKFHKERRLGGAFLNDAGGAIAKRLGAKRTGEAILCDKEGRVLYRGGLDDNLKEPSKAKERYLAAALDEMLAGKPVSVTTGKCFGELVKS